MARKNRTPEENARREKIRELLQMVHTAAASGRWCGAERPLCGLSNSRH